MCFARCDCLGLSCNVAMHQGYKTEYIFVEINLNIDESKLTLVSNGTTVNLNADGMY